MWLKDKRKLRTKRRQRFKKVFNTRSILKKKRICEEQHFKQDNK